MNWLLLNQFYVNTDYTNSKISVLEEVVSSEQQLVQVLASGTVSLKTMMSRGHGSQWFNLREMQGCHL